MVGQLFELGYPGVRFRTGVVAESYVRRENLLAGKNENGEIAAYVGKFSELVTAEFVDWNRADSNIEIQMSGLSQTRWITFKN